MTVRLQRIIHPDGHVIGWVVDLDQSVLYDTSSRFFEREEEARFFADHLSALVGAPIERAPDDVR